MREHDNIDRLFQESFKDFEVDAPQGTWDNIEKKLTQKDDKVIIPLWQKLSGVAAIIAILILAGSQWFVSPNAINSIVDSPNGTLEEVKPTTNPIENQNILENNSLIAPNNQNSNSQVVVSTGTTENTTDQLEVVTNNEVQVPSNKVETSSNNNQSYSYDQTLALNTTDPKQNNSEQQSSLINYSENTDYSSLISALNSKDLIQNEQLNLSTSPIEVPENKVIQPKLKSLVEVAELINSEKSNKKEEQKNSWFVKPQISPILYGNLGSGSAIDQNFNQNSSQGEVNMSYGLNVAYQLNDKMKIRTGINRVNLNYNTNDVFVLPASGFSSINNVDLSANFESSVVSAQQLSNFQDSELAGRFPTEESQLQQQLGFIEIPMELEYKLIDKTIDINIIGGASTLLLNGNSLDIQTGNSTIFLGEANNVNNLSFSTNFAIGLDYDISEKLMLNLEPTFKYQFNTFQSGTTDFQPFLLGIYSGVVFKF